MSKREEIIYNYHEKYKSLTMLCVKTLLTCPNNYYFRTISKEEKKDLEQIALDYGFILEIRPFFEKGCDGMWKANKSKKKQEGYIVWLIKNIVE